MANRFPFGLLSLGGEEDPFNNTSMGLLSPQRPTPADGVGLSYLDPEAGVMPAPGGFGGVSAMAPQNASGGSMLRELLAPPRSGGSSADLPRAGAIEAGPAPMPPQTAQQPPMQLPGATPPSPMGSVPSPMPQGQGQQQGGAPGFMDKLSTVLGGLYGQGGPGDGLITIGAGIASRDGWGKGLQQAGLMMQQQQAQRQKQQGQNATAQLISQKLGIPVEQALGIMQNGGAGQALQMALTSPEQFKTEVRDGDTFQINTRTGQQTLLKKGDEEFRAVTDPAERARLGIPATDRTPYKVDSRGNFQAVGSPSTTINTAPGPAKSVFDSMEKRADDARTSAQAMPAFMEAKRLVDSGNITLGAGADMRVAMQKVGSLFGLDATAASNSETFAASMAGPVLSMVKGLGAGSGISNADRDFAERAAGGRITLEPASIKRLIDLGLKASQAKLDAHNKTLDAVYPDTEDNRQVRSLFQVEVPAFSMPEATAPAPAASNPAAPQRQQPSQQPGSQPEQPQFQRPSWRRVQ